MLNKKDLHEGDFFYKNNPTDKIWWVEMPDGRQGEHLFSFDRETVYNLFTDYQFGKLTPEEKEIFDKENPYWAEFFKGRTQTD